jgi:tripartite-type tricarboxylate transporter receptor subunit TctC
MPQLTRRTVALSLAAMPLLGRSGAAQEAYPSKPVTLVNPLPPGGTTDLVARALASTLEAAFKQAVVVENKPGAAGAIGNAFVAHSKPDGYTLLATQTAVVLIPAADKVLGRNAAYKLAELEPVARLTADPVIVAVQATSPFKTIQELIAAIKAKPDHYSYSSSGTFGALHVPMEMFLRQAGLKMRHVPTTGGGPAITALLGGHVDVGTMAVAGAERYTRAGKFRPLLAIGDVKSPIFPDLPTTTDLHMPVQYALWTGVFAPAGTPEAILARLDAAVGQAVKAAPFVDAMKKVNTPVEYLDRAAFKSYIAAQEKALAAATQALAPGGNKPRRACASGSCRTTGSPARCLRPPGSRCWSWRKAILTGRPTSPAPPTTRP